MLESYLEKTNCDYVRDTKIDTETGELKCINCGQDVYYKPDQSEIECTNPKCGMVTYTMSICDKPSYKYPIVNLASIPING